MRITRKVDIALIRTTNPTLIEVLRRQSRESSLPCSPPLLPEQGTEDYDAHCQHDDDVRYDVFCGICVAETDGPIDDARKDDNLPQILMDFGVYCCRLGGLEYAVVPEAEKELEEEKCGDDQTNDLVSRVV